LRGKLMLPPENGAGSEGRLGAMSWNLQIHLKSNRDEIVYFDSQDEAEAALETVTNQMQATRGLTTISGSKNKTVVDTRAIETVHLYEGM
jgi:hypothetical protein